jgi:hypothetical protein
MQPKEPVLLVVVVETARLRWFVAAVARDGQVLPLLCSKVGDLDRYRELDFDEQVAFLRHRFCGILQRGCDRIWARAKKACQFVVVFKGPLAEPSGRLTQAIADHFAEWLLNPPVAVFVLANGPDPRWDRLAGQIDPVDEQLVRDHLGEVLAVRDDPGAWELARQKGSWC